jgi:hypothetical protein
MSCRDELIDYTIEQRRNTQAVVIAVSGRSPGMRRVLREVFGSLGYTHSAGGVIPSFSSADPGNDYIIVDVKGASPAETAFNTWLARPHILIINEAEASSVEGLENGGIVICSRNNEAYEEIEEAALEAKCYGLFTAGDGEESAARNCESLETANGTRAIVDILGEKIRLNLKPGKEDMNTVLIVLLTAGLCGHELRSPVSTLKNSLTPKYGRANPAETGNLALFENGIEPDNRGKDASFRVMAMVDPGHGKRRMAFLSHMDMTDGCGGQLALPVKTANLDFVYTGNNSLGRNERGSGYLGEIVTDVLSPGDIVKVRGALDRSMGTMIEALRSLPGHIMKGPDTEYAV